VPRFVTSTVSELIAERDGLQRVRLADHSRAYVLTDLTGPVAVGDDVVVNTTAVDLGLGTGGWHVVHWNLARRDLWIPGGGHIMKMRYTSLQSDTGAAEEHLAPTDARDGLVDLGGTPVVVCSLHSQMGVVAAVLAHLRPDLRVSYVMTDGAALPMALSDLVHDLRGRGWLHATITAGNAFGGEIEAVSVPSALELAVGHQRADIVIVAMGPGVVGTGRSLGTTSVEVAAIVDAAVALSARPIVAARASDADERERHQGLSHHTVTALRLAAVAVDVPVPAGVAYDHVADRVPAPHRVRRVDVPDLHALFAAHDVEITTMGRGHDADPLFFACAAAAAVDAVSGSYRPDTVAQP
jgi:hypothetical protein